MSKPAEEPSPSGHGRVLQQRAVTSCLTYSTFSMATTLTNKMILTGNTVSATFLLIWQHIATVVFVLGAREWGAVSFDMPSWDMVMKWLPLNGLFVLMLLSNALAIAYLSIPMVTVIKSLSTVLTGLGDYTFFSQPLTSGIVASMAIMIASSVVAAVNDLQFNLWGYSWAAVNCLSTTAYVLYMRVALKGVSKSEFQAVFLNNSLALPMLVPMLLWSGGYSVGDSLRWLSNAGISGWALFLFNGFAGFALSSSSFWCVKSTSPTTYSMVGSLNKIPLTAIGWVLFDTRMTQLGTISVITGLAGGILYTHCKNLQKKQDTTTTAKSG